MLTAIAPTWNRFRLSPPLNNDSVTPDRWPAPVRVSRIPLDQKEVGGAFYPRRSSRRLIAATLASLLIHAGLAMILWEEPPTAKPVLPLSIALRISKTPPPRAEANPAPPWPAPTLEAPPPPSRSVAVSPEPLSESAPAQTRLRSETKRPEPKTTAMATPSRPRANPKRFTQKPKLRSTTPSRLHTPLDRPKAKTSSPPPSSRPVETVVGARPAPVESTAPLRQPSQPPAIKEPPLILNPRYRHPPQPPTYPRRAIRFGLQGKTVVRARISPVGAVIEVRMHQSSGHALLDEAALAAVRRWAFVPANRNGVPIEAWVQAPVNFVLTENHRSFP